MVGLGKNCLPKSSPIHFFSGITLTTFTNFYKGKYKIFTFSLLRTYKGRLFYYLPYLNYYLANISSCNYKNVIREHILINKWVKSECVFILKTHKFSSCLCEAINKVSSIIKIYINDLSKSQLIGYI